MKKQLNSVLLIDDNAADNFFHQYILKEAGFQDKITAIQSGAKALEYLKSKEQENCLVFLDINMPGMTGWEFIEKYKELESGQKKGVVIVMLTTSLNPYDRNKANDIEVIDDFRNKPLTEGVFSELRQIHFSD